MIAALIAAVFLMPAGFHEAKALEPAASYVAGKHVVIGCAATDLTLREYAQSLYGGDLGYETGMALTPDGAALLGQSVCYPLMAQLSKRHNGGPLLAESLLTLVHEAVHLRGVTDEGQTECTAIHTMPRVAVKFFHVKAGKQLRALMSDAWAAHSGEPAAYTAVC